MLFDTIMAEGRKQNPKPFGSKGFSSLYAIGIQMCAAAGGSEVRVNDAVVAQTNTLRRLKLVKLCADDLPQSPSRSRDLPEPACGGTLAAT